MNIKASDVQSLLVTRVDTSLLWFLPCLTCYVRRVFVPATQACRLLTFVLPMLYNCLLCIKNVDLPYV